MRVAFRRPQLNRIQMAREPCAESFKEYLRQQGVYAVVIYPALKVQARCKKGDLIQYHIVWARNSVKDPDLITLKEVST